MKKCFIIETTRSRFLLLIKPSWSKTLFRAPQAREVPNLTSRDLRHVPRATCPCLFFFSLEDVSIVVIFNETRICKKSSIFFEARRSAKNFFCRRNEFVDFCQRAKKSMSDIEQFLISFSLRDREKWIFKKNRKLLDFYRIGFAVN